MEKINVNKICKFIAVLNDAETQFLNYLIDFRKGIKKLIENHNITADEVCLRFKIKSQEYLAFINGNWEYTILDYSILQAWSIELEHIRLDNSIKK